MIIETFIALLIYEIFLFASYTYVMHKSSKNQIFHSIKEFPTITLVIPMYNEKDVIKEKIKNTVELLYPKDKLKVVILDDYSIDNSLNIASETIKTMNLEKLHVGRMIDNFNAGFSAIISIGLKGKANALNAYYPFVKSDITVISDADALLKSDALMQIVSSFYDETIGGVTGKIVIISNKENISKKQEDSYRNIFDIWRMGESNIYSVSICNGPLMAFRTKLLHKLKHNPKCYADDSDMLFKTIRSGFKVLYNQNAIVYERVPKSLKNRLIQKMKRAAGLQYVYMHNLDMFCNKKYGKFGTMIYPYAFGTVIISPVIVLILTIMYGYIICDNPIFLIMLLPLIIPKIRNMASSFIITQLSMNFTYFTYWLDRSGSWESIDDARYKLKENKQ